MDVSPQSIREIEFREKLRGYNQDDVDEFLERLAAGVEILQERLREATERALRAEQQAREVFDGDDSLRRTLGLAQRTADLAVQEARGQAERIIEVAEAQAVVIVDDALEQARCLAEEAQSQIWADVGRLEAAREQLRQDVATLALYLDGERDRAETVLTEAAAQLHRAVAGPSPPPGLYEIDLSAVRDWGPPSQPAPAVDDSPMDDSGADSRPSGVAPESMEDDSARAASAGLQPPS
ncbi:MAG: DivIVA domain-containing protein [Acidimicrobiales bacterium]